MPSEAGALITKELRGSGVTWQGLTNVYCKLFHFLESDGILDVVNEMHLWALYLFHLYKKIAVWIYVNTGMVYIWQQFF